jgi:hypothetical protein
MSYEKIQRYQRMSPDIQTEWGTYANPHIAVHPDTYKFRQPAVPLLAQGRSDVIHPVAMSGGLGYIGDYVAAPTGMGNTSGLLGNDTLKTLLIVAGIGLLLWWILKQPKEVKANPCVSDFNAMIDSGWTPPGGRGAVALPKRGRQTKTGKRSLRRHAQARGRDSKGRFI